MCGIAGYSITPNEAVNASALTTALLLGIEERGQHATGAAWTDPATDQVWLAKEATAASVFTRHTNVPKDTRTAILHTRWATKGSPKDNENNHPIDVRGIVGVHNGCISNDDAIFAELGADKRIAEVDSEAIFANILHSGKSATAALADLRGSAAVSWLESTSGSVLHVARVSSSPVILGQTLAGSTVFASTERALRRAGSATGLQFEVITSLKEGQYLQIRDGKVISSETFTTGYQASLTAIERRALNIA